MAWVVFFFLLFKVEKVGCGGVGIWYKYRYFFSGIVFFRRGSGLEERVKCEFVGGIVFLGVEVLFYCVVFVIFRFRLLRCIVWDRSFFGFCSW